LKIGEKVLIKGTSYIFGAKIASNVTIEHSILIKKKVRVVKNNRGEVQAVRYFVPESDGEKALSDI
jgi:hypothetical protein